jgi:hypothetical protein
MFRTLAKKWDDAGCEYGRTSCQAILEAVGRPNNGASVILVATLCISTDQDLSINNGIRTTQAYLLDDWIERVISARGAAPTRICTAWLHCRDLLIFKNYFEASF